MSAKYICQNPSLVEMARENFDFLEQHFIDHVSLDKCRVCKLYIQVYMILVVKLFKDKNNNKNNETTIGGDPIISMMKVSKKTFSEKSKSYKSFPKKGGI